jgi:hypothetical protein
LFDAAGTTRACEVLHENLSISLETPLLSALVSGALRLFGRVPARVLGWASKMWSQIYRDAGTMEWVADGPEAGRFELRELPACVAASRPYLIGIAAAMNAGLEMIGEGDVQSSPSMRCAQRRARRLKEKPTVIDARRVFSPHPTEITMSQILERRPVRRRRGERGPGTTCSSRRSHRRGERCRLRAPEARRIDLAGRTLMPGLIDAHVHAVLTTMDLAALEKKPVTLVANEARLVLEGMLRRGFTTVRDAGGADWGLAQAVERGLIRGPRLFFSGRVLSQTGGHGDFSPREAGAAVRLDPLAASRTWPTAWTPCANRARGAAPRRTQVKIWRPVASRHRPTRSGTSSIRWTRCARSSRRRTAGAPTRWRTPTHPRRSRARRVPAFAATSTAI